MNTAWLLLVAQLMEDGGLSGYALAEVWYQTTMSLSIPQKLQWTHLTAERASPNPQACKLLPDEHRPTTIDWCANALFYLILCAPRDHPQAEKVWILAYVSRSISHLILGPGRVDPVARAHAVRKPDLQSGS